VILFLSIGISAREAKVRSTSNTSSLNTPNFVFVLGSDTHVLTFKSSKSQSLVQFKAISQIKTLEDLLSVDVYAYQAQCSEMFQLQSMVNGYVAQLGNYTLGSMDQDLQRLKTAKSLVSEVISSLTSGTPAMIQLTNHAQLQETVTLISKLHTLSLIKGDSFESIKSKVTKMLTSSTLDGQADQANDLLTSINSIIQQVNSVKHQLFSVHEVNALEKKRKTLSSLIQSSCATGAGSQIVQNVTKTDALPDYAVNRAYISDNNEPFFLELTGAISVNLTATTLTEYVVGGWVRWLDFIDGTYDHSQDKDPAVIFRLFSQDRKDLADDKYYEDRHVYITTDGFSYNFCVHDTNMDTLDNCNSIDVSSFNRENEWDFVLLMYSYTNGDCVARVKAGNQQWFSVDWGKAVGQVPFTGYLGAFVGGDDFYTDRTSFNGEVSSFQVWFGTNTFWASQPGAFDDSNEENILETYFLKYEDVPAISNSIQVSNDVVELASDQYSLYTFINTFIEATDYGFGLWVKVDSPGQIATLSFDTRTDIDTPGNAIAQVYVQDGGIWVEVTYENQREPANQVQNVASVTNDWFLVQVQFSGSNGQAQVFIEQNGQVSTTTFSNFGEVYVPQNVFLTVGASDVLGKSGAVFSYKTTTVYAGSEQLYGLTCDKSCLTCSGTTASDCDSCVDGFYVDNGICTACDESCATCDGCGKDHCTTCNAGTVLVNGQCYCDPTCATCNGITDGDCLSCNSHQVLINGRCNQCNSACKECTDPSSTGCSECDDGFKLSSGQCVPACDTSACKTCTSDNSQCASCHDGQTLYNGECIQCDPSCNTCSGPENYQCIDCVAPAQFSCGKCIVCDSSCLTCDGSTSTDCLTCTSDKELVGTECLVPCDETAGNVRVGNQCVPCDSSCQTCSGTASSQCTSCDDDHVLSKGYCVPPNPQPCDTTHGYVLINNNCIFCDINNGYGLINDKCIQCDPSCKSCYGTDPNNCIACYDPNILSNGKCGPEEPICDPSCKTCNGASANDCIDCPDGTTLNSDGQCVNVPPPPPPCDTDNGYVIVDGICEPCDQSCATCSGVNDTDCITCNGNDVLDKDSGLCVPPCDTDNGFVMINGVCYPCDSTCATCSGKTATDCVTCVENLNFDNGACVPPCDTNNGFVMINRQCLPCHSSCLTCKDVSNRDCTSCDSGLILQAGACVEPPVDCEVDNGFVLVNDNCVPCDKSCKTCDDISDASCTSCDDDLILVSGACIVQPVDCDMNNGQIYINGQCFDCDQTCKTCSGVADTNCIVCADGLVFDNSKCVEFCDVDNGFYKSNGQCLPCDQSCLTCDGDSNTNCVTCVDADFWESGRCLPTECVSDSYDFTEDKDGTCSSDCDCDGTRRCDPNGQCEDCTLLHELYPDVYNTDLCPPCADDCLYCRGPNTNECTDCNNGTFLNNGECDSCDGTCFNCNGPSSADCTECIPLDVLINGVCNVPCDVNNGFFYEDSQHCLPCGKNCQTCNGENNNNCLTCVDGTELQSDNECLVPCDTDKGFFYDDQDNCVACDESCMNCDGPADTNCTECSDAYFLEFGKCLPSKCVSSDYTFDESIVTECNSDCECDGTRRCDPNGECQDCNVLINLYPNIYTNIVCPPCEFECHTCRGANSDDCTTCKPGYYFDSGSCLPCDSSCATCSGPSADECLTCDVLHVLRVDQCVPPCDESNGYFYDKDDNCLPCDDSCKTCFDTTNESCLSCYGEDDLLNNICWPPCDTKGGFTYDDNYNCVACNTSCLTCDGVSDSNCTDCNTGFSIIDGRCISCVSFYYVYDESSNPNGPSHCSSDCECDNIRRCGPNGVCQDCSYLTVYFPTLFSASDCPTCDSSCLTCSGPGPNDCTACEDGFYLGSDDACYPCDSSCSKCDGPTNTECTECADKDDNLVSGQCVSPPPTCDTSCLTCDGPTNTNCTSCADDKELTNDGECVPIDCVSWTYDFDEVDNPMGAHRCDDDCECDGTRRCSPTKYCQECLDLVNSYPNLYDLKDCPVCDSSCNTCQGPSDHDCTSCLAGFYLTSSNTCNPCDSSCALCDGGSAQDCTACPAETELNDNNECVIPCDPTCLTCSTPAVDGCTSCTADKTLIGGICYVVPVCVKLDYSHDESTNVLGPNRCINDCDCDSSRRCSPDGYCGECMYLANLYPSLFDSKDCPACDATCLTCQGPKNTDCTACADGDVLLNGQCLPCDKSCLTCSNVDDQSCTSCDSDLILSNGQCVSPPLVCDKSCLECDGPASSDCTSCPDDFELSDGYCLPINCISWNYTTVEADGGRCNNDCDCDGARRCSPDKYCQECDALSSQFPSLYLPSDCPVCDSSCATCDGPTSSDCTSCDAGFVLVTGSCEECDKSCATCDGLTDNDCTTCYSGYLLQSTSTGAECVVPPPVCDSSCYTCSGSSDKDCTSCASGYQLAFDGSCQPIETCVKWGYSHDESSNVLGAGRCSDDCDCDGTRRCSPTGYCLACEDLATTFPDQYSLKDCPVCDDTCLTCDGPTAQDCTSCNDGSFFDNGVCNPCGVSNCLYCVNDDETCGKCEDGYVLDDKDGCVEPPIECDSSCLECSGPNPDQCTECPGDAVLQNGFCVTPNCIAFDYQYDELSSPLGAHRCNDDCECDGSRRCSPDKYCAECVDLVYEYPAIYAFSDCPACDKSCVSCDGPTDTDCTSCEAGEILTKDGTCVPCDSSCATCQDETSTGCVTCPPGNDLQADGSCTPHYDCDITCLTCDGPNADQCLSCNTTTRELVQGKCVLTCVQFDYTFKEDPSGVCTTDCDCDGTRRCGPSGVCDECNYLDATFPALFDPKDCPSCDQSCNTCFGPDPDQCKSCVDGDYLASDSSCQACDKNCKTCDTGDESGCTSCYDPEQLNNGFCVQPNPQCSDNCVTCFGPGEAQCVTCKDNFELEDGACVPVQCVSWDYMVNELLNKDGPGTCSDDCDCDGTRRCGPDGFCHECLDLASLYPTVYLESDCPVCDQSCLTCKGATNQSCTTCVDGDYLQNGECLPCDPTCLTCDGGDNNDCLTCPTGTKLTTTNTCSPPFPICDPTCVTCVGPKPTDCTKCDVGFSLSGGECKNTTECDDWDYVTNEASNPNGPYTCSNDCDCEGTRRCSPNGYCHECSTLAEQYPTLYTDCPVCDATCLTCDGPTADDCVYCNDGFYLDKDDGCLPCDTTCATCFSGTPDTCITCPSDRVLQSGYCTIVNPVCDPTCLTCNGPLATNCVICADGFKLSDQGTCEEIDCISFDYVWDESLNVDGCKDDCDCDGSRRCGPSGYCDSCLDLAELYPTTYPPTDCPVCDNSCDDCDGPSNYNCTKCPDGIYLFNGQCIDCNDNCATCYGTGVNNCLTCASGMVLWNDQCWTPDPTCDPTCVTCSGSSNNECTSCPCDNDMINGQCIPKVITCDSSCLTCIGTASNQCSSCDKGLVLIKGQCVDIQNFVGFRKFDESPIKYEVTKKISDKSDIAVGTWSRYVPADVQGSDPYNVLFRLSGLSSRDKELGTNDYRFSSLVVYYNSTHYTFETYSKASGTPVLVQKYVPVSQSQLENSWNLIFFGYSRANAKATGYIVFPDGTQQTVEFSNVVQDKPDENMEVLFFGDDVYNGFNGEVSTPEVLHGSNFLQTFDINNKNTYFPFKGRSY